MRAHDLALCAVALLLAADVKLVLKSTLTAEGGAVDAFVVAELAVYLAVAGYLLLVRLRRFPTLSGARPLEVLLLAFALLVLAGAAVAPNPFYGGARGLQLLVLVLLAWVAAREPDTRWFVRFAVAFVTSALVLVLAGLVLPSQRPPLQEERFNWFATHSTTVGQHLAIAVALAAVFVACSAAYRLPANRWLLSSGALAALIAALAANHTRGALVAAGLAAAVGVLAMVPARWRPSLAAAGVWAVASAAVGASAAFASWFARGDSVEQIATLNARTGLWRVAASGTFAEDPFFGLGTGASRSVFVAQTGLGGGHNAALNVFVDGGLVALLLWAGLVLGVVVALMRPGSAARGTDMQERLAYAAACAACTAVLVSAAVHEGLGAPAGTAVTWLAMTVAYLGSAARTRRQPSRPGTGCPPVPAEGVMLRSDTPATAGRHP